MSIYPCATDGRRITGSANSVYAWCANGSWSSRKRSNYCADHIGPQRDKIAAHTDLVYIGEVPQLDPDALPDGCRLCKRTDADYTLFVDIFARGEDRRTYRAKLCEDHIEAVAQNVRIAI